MCGKNAVFGQTTSCLVRIGCLCAFGEGFPGNRPGREAWNQGESLPEHPRVVTSEVEACGVLKSYRVLVGVSYTSH
jgi:hypothetical protein